ncbi:MAG: pyroglutamyl-peptidase I [Oscillospiraceae bacterium]
MIKLLITGFEPFGKDTVNASMEVVKRLPEMIGGAKIVKLQLPVVYDGVAEILENYVNAEKPNAVICVGQAGGRTAVTPEKIAINWKSGALADNAGKICSGEVICPDGPDGLFATLPVEEMAAAMLRVGVPAKVSYTAGTYVCNCTMYHLMQLLNDFPGVLGGFIHVPPICEQVLGDPSRPSMPLDLIVRGLEAAAAATVKVLDVR